MSAYTEFFLKSKRSAAQLQMLKVEHPSFSKTYQHVRNSAKPVTVNVGGTFETYTYAPMQIKQVALNDDMDTGFEFQLGDLGEILGREVSNLNKADINDPTTGYRVKPQVTYYEFDSTNLNEPLIGPIHLEIKSFNYTREGSAFTAGAPQLNNNRTGEIYTLDRFPSLKGFATFSTYYVAPIYLEYVSGGNIYLVNGEKLELEA